MLQNTFAPLQALIGVGRGCADAAASAFMLPIVCFPFLTPAMRILANLFPDTGMRQVMPCCWQLGHGPASICPMETRLFCQTVNSS